MTESSTPEPLKAAVLFLVFNRPETTTRVFDAIRQARPTHLYVGADGARGDREGEAERVIEVRRIATQIDWPCEVKTLFRERNLGCRDAVTEAINWFFEHEEAGIILEDDCLPSSDFFVFCDALLKRYRNDQRIWQISGYNATPTSYAPYNSSYLYSAYGSIWGWATWRDRWANFEPNLSIQKGSGMVEFALDALPKDEYPDRRRRQLDRVISEQRSIWDFQWFYTRLVNSGLSVVPKRNLISNIGFGADSTHTSSAPPFPQPALEDIEFPLVAPPRVLRDRKRDVALLDANYARIDRSPRAVLSHWVRRQLLWKLRETKND